jgi:16S rRNA (cytosine1402-N4)-methyltransferase
MSATRRSTPSGEHRAVLLGEVLAALRPQPGEVVVDCTVGWAGHAGELLRRVGPEGRLLGIDFDPENLEKARERLAVVGYPFSLHHGNFAGLPAFLAEAGLSRMDTLVADLGMSSMQVDDAERGFSYMRDGPLDMRMDRTRGRTAAELLATISEGELAEALRGLGDEPDAGRIAAAVVRARSKEPITRTTQLARVILEAVPQPKPAGSWKQRRGPNRWQTHPAARIFQVLRILVNRELANLERLLRILPEMLNPGGRAAIISFHSGEDRLVKAGFRDGLRAGLFQEVSDEAVRATFAEKTSNPRSRSAKLRWAIARSRASGAA